MRKIRNTSGQGMTEYIIIVAIVAIAAVAGFKLFGEKIRTALTGSTKVLEEGTQDGINTGTGTEKETTSE